MSQSVVLYLCLNVIYRLLLLRYECLLQFLVALSQPYLLVVVSLCLLKSLLKTVLRCFKQFVLLGYLKLYLLASRMRISAVYL